MRTLKFKDALSEGLCQAMADNDAIFVTGIGVAYNSGIFGTTTEALKRFGPARVFDSPACENALTGICIGAAAMGKRPVIVHARCDFSFLASDMLINLAAKFRYMFGGNAGTCPVVTRMIIGRGWGQGATHSQSLQSLYGHIPGLAVVMPGTPHEARGLTIEALRADHPTVILEHRSLYEIEGECPEAVNGIGIDGDGDVLRHGGDITIVATSFMVQEAMRAADTLLAQGIAATVISQYCINPFDPETIVTSVEETGRLLVVDTSWENCGFASEVCATVAEKAFHALKAPPRRLGMANCPAPVSKPLEDAFYPKASTIVGVVLDMLGREKPEGMGDIDRVDTFKGPY